MSYSDSELRGRHHHGHDGDKPLRPRRSLHCDLRRRKRPAELRRLQRRPELLRDATGPRLLLAAAAGDVAASRRLLRAGADPNAADRYRRSALHVAAAKGHADVVGALLAAGADPNARDERSNTPLHLVACSNRPYVAALLVHHGALVSLRDDAGHSPLDLARSRQRLLERSGRREGAAGQEAAISSETCLTNNMVRIMMRPDQHAPVFFSAELGQRGVTDFSLDLVPEREMSSLLSEMSEISIS